ncbi:MAG: hypothetical protein A2381_07185 [Bdellovibrionales bacterium RIFOXYB1_FULL_37_110]|nr:MAG: hypothetical protein A2417_15060 [Bdellovibrionales bacterium RIFOXYC1_FULL_37_79]OFZ57855.1 MAG: hypothetical protein A2381_07185 [Bdellovibrionales bacterium RIFOXYB1_FULL_37_110]OFZ62821.1 MAG: hypothetical protein A2577_16705 [Bdellovibrionales bacterium RIFOXYD1_FULL_36_51]
MIEDILRQEEGKNIEFKENTNSLPKIITTAIAFANTSGGVIIIGIEDKNKKIVGVTNPLLEEEKLANAFSDSIKPRLLPDIQIISYREKQLILINIPHINGPFYLKNQGLENGVYVRLGSTNRLADLEIIENLKRQALNITFDEQLCFQSNPEDIDLTTASELLGKKVKLNEAISLGLIGTHGKNSLPTNGGIILFGKNKDKIFPDARILCARFKGINTNEFLDEQTISGHLAIMLKQILSFISRHTNQAIKIKTIKSQHHSEYPIVAIREAVINALVHADYSLSGESIKVAIFDNRIEITNPGGMPFGITIESALKGISKLRNRVIGRFFKELGLIEQWGSGLGRIIDQCHKSKLPPPVFEEVGNSFRVTIFNHLLITKTKKWQNEIIHFLKEKKEITSPIAAKLWKISDRAARDRLRKLVIEGLLIEIGTGPNDPYKKYKLKTRGAL